jgi:hypothetical protein
VLVAGLPAVAEARTVPATSVRSGERPAPTSRLQLVAAGFSTYAGGVELRSSHLAVAPAPDSPQQLTSAPLPTLASAPLPAVSSPASGPPVLPTAARVAAPDWRRAVWAVAVPSLRSRLVVASLWRPD